MREKKFRTQFDRRVVYKSFEGVDSLADQQFKDECTVEGLVRRYGILPRPEVQPVGADVSQMTDFAECMERVQAACDQFASMPSDIRARFGNDPRAFMEFVCDPANVDECVKIGLMEVRKDQKSAVEVLEDIASRMPVSSEEPKQA